ncbi:TadE family type IV pilus minor pilin [Streptomyces sp. NPDC006384]|uniref:TadE family type IV pilus minor pilin n=1 Tax=Streptomyces sp. NPDC006384 TaxID=3364745 RepID=UPI0036768B40
MTAETAVVLPVLMVFAMALVWGLLVVAAQIQCVDAARAGARAAARRDPADAVVEVARETAPRGARVTVGREGDRVRVVVEAGPPVLHGLPFEVREEAVAAVEQPMDPVVAGARPAVAEQAAEPATKPAGGTTAGSTPGRSSDAAVDETEGGP